MSFEIIVTSEFETDLKKLRKKLSKKKQSIDQSFETLINQLSKNPFIGDVVSNCGLQQGEVRKIRLPIAGRGGKSYGARLICYIVKEDDKLFLIAIYDKADSADMSRNDIKAICNAINSE